MRIVFDDGVCEEVEVEPAGEYVRLLMTPLASNTHARLGDLVELQNEEGDVARFLRIVEPSTLVTLERIVGGETALSESFLALLAEVRAMGGECERAFGGIFLLHVPPPGVTAVEKRLQMLAERPTPRPLPDS